MAKPKVLLQFDTDTHPSSFDSMVAVDSGVDQLLTYSNVQPDELEPLVHGAMFTRGGADLCHTALFFGGSDVAKTGKLFERAQQCFWGSIRVSVMADPNGSNTTAAAAVLSAEAHLELKDRQIVVLAGTGPVGIRIAQLVCERGGNVRLCSRKLDKAKKACEFLEAVLASSDNPGQLEPVETGNPKEAAKQVVGADALFAAGAAGICLLEAGWETRESCPAVAVDINAVPPVGIAGIGPTDSGQRLGDSICFGAIGVGGLKMKIHKQCIRELFLSNEIVMDTRSIYRIGKSLVG